MIIQANVAAQRIGLLWLALGGVVLVVFHATGRPPRLGALDAVAPEGSVDRAEQR